MKQRLTKQLMPRNLKPLLLTLHHPLQLLTRRLTLRFQVSITVQIAIQRGYTLPALSYQPVEENTDLLTAYRRVMKLMILGIRILLLMSRNMPIPTHTHNIVPLLALRMWTNRPNRGRGQPQRQNNNINVRRGNAPYPRPWEGQPYGWHTRSQQAVHARAYRKWQHWYQVL